MILYQKANMKNLLAQGLYLCMKEKPFHKITIKQICDKTGVIRGTFYNHFIDKYETLEYLVHQLLLEKINDTELSKEKLKIIFEVVYQHQDFFSQCFQIEGQNSFESILQNVLKDFILQSLNDEDWQHIDKNIPIDFFISYYINAIIYILKYWLNHHFQQSPQEIYQMTLFLFSNSIKDIL